MPLGRTPNLVARVLDNPAMLLAMQICVTLPFLVGGLTKLFSWDTGVAETAGLGLHPAWIFNLATVLTELGGSMLVIAGFATWLGAGALGIFTVIATFLGHRFWEQTGAERPMQLNSFLEHATIAAAFVVVAVIAIRNEQAAKR